MLVPFSPNLAVALALLTVRFSLAQMDVPPGRHMWHRSSRPARGLVRAGAHGRGSRRDAGGGPLIAGVAIQAAAADLPFLLAGGLKISYDLGLYATFSQRPGGHEVPTPAAQVANERRGRKAVDGSSAPMRPISGFTDCAARSRIDDALAALLVASPGSGPPGSPNLSSARLSRASPSIFTSRKPDHNQRGGTVAESARRNSRFPARPANYRRDANTCSSLRSSFAGRSESVAAQRRKLPLGGEVPEDYVF